MPGADAASVTTFNTVPANTLASTYESIDAALANTALKTANATDKKPEASATTADHSGAAAAGGKQKQAVKKAAAVAKIKLSTSTAPSRSKSY